MSNLPQTFSFGNQMANLWHMCVIWPFNMFSCMYVLMKRLKYKCEGSTSPSQHSICSRRFAFINANILYQTRSSVIESKECSHACPSLAVVCIHINLSVFVSLASSFCFQNSNQNKFSKNNETRNINKNKATIYLQELKRTDK